MYELKHIFSFYFNGSLEKLLFCEDKADDLLFLIKKEFDLYQRILIILRMKEGDTFICFDDISIYFFKIIEINKKYIKNKLLSKKFIESNDKRVIAFVPLLERNYMNEIFYMIGQQGINEVQLIKTDLSQIKEYTEKDYLRFEKLMISGCEQGKQYRLPVLNKNFLSIEDVIKFDKKLYWFYEDGAAIKSVILSDEKEYFFLCGPERGFSKKEFDLLNQSKKCQSIKLSSYILRSIDVIQFGAIFFKSI